ncbi:PepSY domain-containing protein [Streptococcus sp. H31]|uniref:PepSY domain-containing protein n=1 Tax=Streptococcus huangxiaojuni TaxID=3237239 RepID=UPI0034A18A69
MAKKQKIVSFILLILAVGLLTSCQNNTASAPAGSSSSQVTTDNNSPTGEVAVPEDEAVDIVLGEAGVTKEEAKDMQVKSSVADSGEAAYDISFIYNSATYRYLISAETGGILEQTIQKD